MEELNKPTWWHFTATRAAVNKYVKCESMMYSRNCKNQQRMSRDISASAWEKFPLPAGVKFNIEISQKFRFRQEGNSCKWNEISNIQNAWMHHITRMYTCETSKTVTKRCIVQGWWRCHQREAEHEGATMPPHTTQNDCIYWASSLQRLKSRTTRACSWYSIHDVYSRTWDLCVMMQSSCSVFLTFFLFLKVERCWSFAMFALRQNYLLRCSLQRASSSLSSRIFHILFILSCNRFRWAATETELPLSTRRFRYKYWRTQFIQFYLKYPAHVTKMNSNSGLEMIHFLLSLRAKLSNLNYLKSSRETQ